MRCRAVTRLGHRLRLLAREQRGFTLIEMLVTMAIMGVVIGAVAMLFTSGTKAEVDLNLRFSSQTEARLALDTFRREVHNACSATVSGTSGSVTDPGGTARTRYPVVALKTLDSGYACSVNSANWCTVGSGSSYSLYRQSGATTCSSSSTRRAQYLTRGTIFMIATATGLLPKIGVDMTVNRSASVARLSYRIHDDIALRNGARG
jgi:prepilin-type N-terminal cleavage/methylation domain-containing protein